LNRVDAWDELRGVAISFMIFVHFFYYNSSVYYQFSMFNILQHVSGVFELTKGLLNLHTSYLAPFLFLFIVGIISHIKFSKQKGPLFLGAFKRFLKLYCSTMFLGLILPLDFNHLAEINYLKLPFITLTSKNILMIIAYVYLINEFILHAMLKYFNQKLLLKMIVIIVIGLLIVIFNIKAKTAYATYHELPLYLVILFGVFTSILGDLFLSINDNKTENNKKMISILYILIPIGICLGAAIWIKPSLGAIKEMNIIYFMYCFALAVIIIAILNAENKSKLFQSIKNILSLLGRHSLGLYIFHFFIGYIIEKFFLARFIAKQYWSANILMIFIACLIFAELLDKIQDKRRDHSRKLEAII
jgi:surface polysaccharide O-acyltransferase-like enzyme